MATYIHERPEWPQLTWDQDHLAKELATVRLRQGKLIGRMEALGFPLREEAVLNALTEDVLKSSEIEGEILDKDQVRSSIARRLGIEIGALAASDRNVEGVVEMMLDATQKYKEPLTADRLFGWHASLFPAGRSGLSKITIGAWRDDALCAMQVVSKVYSNNPRVHYRAPAASRLEAEMKTFLDWYNSENALDPVLKAALAHLWFVTIHPFDDGNGRIARAIADMSLARSEDSSQRFYSMSAQIRVERNAYYDILEETQKGSLDVTAWLEWFLGCLDRAFAGAEQILTAVFRKADFWKKHSAKPINDRQRDILNRLLNGFEGKLTSSKYAKIEKTSQDTALRDINELIDLGILVKEEGGGRSTNYALVQTE
ncbi:Fic family protein [Bradyrhizobium sp. 179]|uniref:Fic family protein n=1 Tax=Bradyrhizobium sp. 179 TaxID=2782648 RepID=UPI001FF88CDC|nr:Fic family protein [Bradyrhizobium sp. 179]MCK1542353.1 Fic family protein [Bradyrhizobium sp. 179]